MALTPSINITFESLSNPKDMIKKANANVRRVMPQVSSDLGSSSPGTIESGGVTIGAARPSSEFAKLRKKKKLKNKVKTKHKKVRK